MHNELIKMLDEKLRLFQQYEELTVQLLEAEDDDAMVLFDQRGKLIELIDVLDADMRAYADKHGSKLYEIIKNRVNRGELSPEEAELYDKGAEIFTVISSISRMEVSLKAEYEQKRDNAAVQLKQTNKNERLIRYFDSVSPGGAPAGLDSMYKT